MPQSTFLLLCTLSMTLINILCTLFPLPTNTHLLLPLSSHLASIYHLLLHHHYSEKYFNPELTTMVLLMVLLLRLLATSFHRAARKMINYGFHLSNVSFKPSSSQYSPPPPSFPSITKCGLNGRESQTVVCDIHRVLLRSHSFFPFFMLVAFEGGSIFRAFLLLLSCPVLWVLDSGLKVKVMTFITFCGLRKKDMENNSRAVLPKFYLENLNPEACEVLGKVGFRVVITRVPRVMVEGFLREYLSVDEVIGTELQSVGGYFTGLVGGSGLVVKHAALKDYFGDTRPDIGLGCSHSVLDHLIISLCKVKISTLSVKATVLRLIFQGLVCF